MRTLRDYLCIPFILISCPIVALAYGLLRLACMVAGTERIKADIEGMYKDLM